MTKWLLRGLVFAALMVFVRLLQGVLINAMDTWALTISITLVVLFAIAALAWGIADGRSDARANPDPDRRGDLAMTWLLAGLFAGVVSGLVAWFISLFYDNLYAESLLNEVTTFAAFTALLVFVAAIAGVAIGRYLVDRKAPPVDAPRRRRRARGHRRVRGRSRRRLPGACRLSVHRRDHAGEPREESLVAVGQVTQRQQVSLHAESDDDAGGDGAQV